MDKLPGKEDERVLVGTGTSDDAGVYRLTDDIALVQEAGWEIFLLYRTPLQAWRFFAPTEILKDVLRTGFG